ncbi:hypothetical protein HanIR_Chr05g0211141 [Helianthus annuus]|nr:hypothetical protein HanIR_Chr05g0211141 [Helianthus annuus]
MQRSPRSPGVVGRVCRRWCSVSCCGYLIKKKVGDGRVSDVTSCCDGGTAAEVVPMWWRVRLINDNSVSVFNTTDRRVIFTSPELVAVFALCSGGKI